jgi:hypothetical protein
MEKFVFATDLDKTKSLDELREELRYYREEFKPSGMAGHMWRDVRIRNLLVAIARFPESNE